MTFSDVKKYSLIAISLVILLAVLFLAASATQSSNIAEEKVRESFALLGLETKLLPRPQRGWTSITYNNIILDKDEISTIKSLTAGYNPFSILLSHELNSLAFENLSVIGEWELRDLSSASFSGWKIPDPANLASLPVKKIRFQKGKISVLTPAFGGLSLDFDLEGTIGDNKMDFQSHVESAQRYISFVGNSNGVVTRDYYNIELEIDEGKFDVPEAHIRASRAHGWFNFTRDRSGAAKTMAELRAGGLTVLNTPWQNTSATAEIKDSGIRIFSEARSVGIEGIELGLNMQKDKNSTPAVYGNLHAEQGSLLAEYIEQQTNLELPKADMTVIRHANSLKIDFMYENASPSKIKYRINTMEGAPIREVVLKQP